MNPPGKPRRSSQDRQPHFMKQWRQAYGLMLKEMATAINDRRGYKMTTVATLSRVENGELEYRQDMLEAYAEVLGITPADLLARVPRDPEVVWVELMKTVDAMQMTRELKAKRKKKRPS